MVIRVNEKKKQKMDAVTCLDAVLFILTGILMIIKNTTEEVLVWGITLVLSGIFLIVLDIIIRHIRKK